MAGLVLLLVKNTANGRLTAQVDLELLLISRHIVESPMMAQKLHGFSSQGQYLLSIVAPPTLTSSPIQCQPLKGSMGRPGEKRSSTEDQVV